MTQLAFYKKIVSAIGIAAGVTVTKFLIEFLESKQIPTGLTIFFSIVTVGVIYLVVHEGFSHLVDSWQRLRKLLLRDRFIEGTWLTCVWENRKHKFSGTARFVHVENGLRMSGENFDPKKGMACGWFRTDMVVVAWPVMQYKYTWSRHANENPNTQGYGELQFAERNGPPTRATGFFIDIADGKRYDWSAEKLSDIQELKALDDFETLTRFMQQNIPNRFAPPRDEVPPEAETQRDDAT